MTTAVKNRPSSTVAGIRWHRPLLVLAAAMVALVVVCLIGLVVDPRQSLGVNVWEKPLKFAISTAIYAVTWSWLIGQLRSFQRVAWWAGTVSAILLLIELVIITGAAAAGITSHFNVSTPFNTVLWSIMAGSIGTLWVATFVVSIILFRNPLGDRARTLAIRAGALIALAGMALAFLMTGPTAAQLDDWQGIAGAHTVGLADGGPGLPLLGWSTVAGDLRIPHFVGMHALQIIPLALILIELASRRIAVLRAVDVRYRLVAIVSATYVAVLAVLTWQALRGQSIVAPDAATATVTLVIAALALAAVAVVLLQRQHHHRPAV
ncbi:MAG: hypothetical protein LCH43_07200 [Actinobacteria bacterium]|nr:hypothetical protein [Actinomycetota bacterium]